MLQRSAFESNHEAIAMSIFKDQSKTFSMANQSIASAQMDLDSPCSFIQGRFGPNPDRNQRKCRSTASECYAAPMCLDCGHLPIWHREFFPELDPSIDFSTAVKIHWQNRHNAETIIPRESTVKLLVDMLDQPSFFDCPVIHIAAPPKSGKSTLLRQLKLYLDREDDKEGNKEGREEHDLEWKKSLVYYVPEWKPPSELGRNGMRTRAEQWLATLFNENIVNALRRDETRKAVLLVDNTQNAHLDMDFWHSFLKDTIAIRHLSHFRIVVAGERFWEKPRGSRISSYVVSEANIPRAITRVWHDPHCYIPEQTTPGIYLTRTEFDTYASTQSGSGVGQESPISKEVQEEIWRLTSGHCGMVSTIFSYLHSHSAAANSLMSYHSKELHSASFNTRMKIVEAMSFFSDLPKSLEELEELKKARGPVVSTLRDLCIDGLIDIPWVRPGPWLRLEDHNRWDSLNYLETRGWIMQKNKGYGYLHDRLFEYPSELHRWWFGWKFFGLKVDAEAEWGVEEDGSTSI
ncbi:hypothetical protein BJ508DRAFT_310713 [Ascobolus immersus RN42]|uniref:Uncharacterized protein n=1 Tax=Ascobolus immersus RN42 TaxID=1160509 RepID=A0A3N4HT42_ASCIM|nr:hypothetical protein BJ508DRAFT_310713 [Ascobolus immersus RN42]